MKYVLMLQSVQQCHNYSRRTPEQQTQLLLSQGLPKSEMFGTYLPTLSAPRSGSDLRMWWKSSACSLGGIFQDRRKSSAYMRHTQTTTVLTKSFHRSSAVLDRSKHRQVIRGRTCFGRAQRASKSCDSHHWIDGAPRMPLDHRGAFWGVGRPQSSYDGLRGVVRRPQQRDIAAVCKMWDGLRLILDGHDKTNTPTSHTSKPLAIMATAHIPAVNPVLGEGSMIGQMVQGGSQRDTELKQDVCTHFSGQWFWSCGQSVAWSA